MDWSLTRDRPEDEVSRPLTGDTEADDEHDGGRGAADDTDRELLRRKTLED